MLDDVIELSGSPSVVDQMIELLQTNLSRTSIIKNEKQKKTLMTKPTWVATVGLLLAISIGMNRNS